MIDKRVICGKHGKALFARHELDIERSKMFSEYGKEIIREITKLLMVRAVTESKAPEELDEEVKRELFPIVSKAAYKIAVDEMLKLATGGVQEFAKTVKESFTVEGGE